SKVFPAELLEPSFAAGQIPGRWFCVRYGPRAAIDNNPLPPRGPVERAVLVVEPERRITTAANRLPSSPRLGCEICVSTRRQRRHRLVLPPAIRRAPDSTAVPAWA